jgi:hypothetical protein
MTAPISRAVYAGVKCTICGAGYGKCDCWTPCACGWVFEKGTKCNNPAHKILRGVSETSKRSN